MYANVAIGILSRDNHFLFTKRKNGNFSGLWGLVGGKLNDGEHIDEAIVRELREETDLNVRFSAILGLSTEVITDKCNTISTALYCCLVELADYSSISEQSWFSKKEKQELKWFTKEELYLRDDIIGSDLIFLNHFYFDRDSIYIRIDCQRNKNGKYTWRVV
jgi:ADP-ribose pyrophosphatase YjhB (NUDIX family)